MRVEGLTIALRERTPWQAVDLGVALLRAHWRVVLPAWALASALALLVCVGIGALSGSDWLGGLLLWWLKPLFDRIPLYQLSHAVFGRAPGLRETLGAAWRWQGRRILPWLLWRRLHPARSLLLPMDLLEQPEGGDRAARLRVLSAISGSPQGVLTLIGAHLELMLWLAIIAFALMFVPVEFLPDSTRALIDRWSEDSPWWLVALNNAVYWLVMLLLEPAYVAAGFGLYLNRRTALEGWDIELAFRRLAARMAAPLALLLGLGLGAASLPAAAAKQAEVVLSKQETGMPVEVDGTGAELPADARSLDARLEAMSAAPRAAFEAAAAAAMHDPDLDPRETRSEWRPIGAGQEQRAALPPWLQALVQGLALLFEHALWIALAILLVVLLVQRRRWLRWFGAGVRPGPEQAPAAPRLLAAAEPLPADIVGAARALWDAGERRAALALLYRAAVAGLVEALGAPLPPGATEADCLRLARGLADADAQARFRRVVGHWQAAAYAHREPAAAAFEQLLQDYRAPTEASR